jgi:hypothetical protein
MLVDELNNYDEANIAAIREKWANEDSVKDEVYTMVETNTACDVEITEESMRLCAKALIG